MNYYNRKAKLLFEKYQSLNPARLHAHWLQHVPPKPGLALDVGAGSGRDAIWLAQKGWEVIAVEPAQALRALGKKASEGHLVRWVDDCLPELTNIHAYRLQFSLILVSGILMHLSQEQRDASMETLANFMAEKSVLVVTLRHGPDSEGRNFNQVSADEMIQFAKKRSFQVEAGDAMPDKLGRDSVVWQTIVLTKGGVAE